VPQRVNGFLFINILLSIGRFSIRLGLGRIPGYFFSLFCFREKEGQKGLDSCEGHLKIGETTILNHCQNMPFLICCHFNIYFISCGLMIYKYLFNVAVLEVLFHWLMMEGVYLTREKVDR